MHVLLTHLLDERGAIRLAFDLAIALGTLAVIVAWSVDALRARRQRPEAGDAAAEEPRAAA